MEIREYGADDPVVEGVVDLRRAVSAQDAPWANPWRLKRFRAMLRFGYDGEPPRGTAALVDGDVVADCLMWTSEWDNRHLAWLELCVHPDARRRGHGSELLTHVVGKARAEGRTSVGGNGWDSPGTRAFAGAHGFEHRSQSINRRQYVDRLDRAQVDRLFEEAAAAAKDYELERIFGPTPDGMLDEMAELVSAINDAPMDDLDLEDEVFTPERVRAYEEATIARSNRFYRVVARHRDSGVLAGNSVVAVAEDLPTTADQHDTSVVRGHRGHSLGLLLKTGMLRWLAEEEPQLRTIDTWNAESNDRMIAVNEQLGYQVMGRGLHFQRDI